jgi:flagellin
MSSILTNTGALVALQTLKGIDKGMAKVQNEVSTGMKVATAKDNSSTWSIASTMRSDIGSFRKLSESLTSASAAVGVARSAAEQISDILKQVQEKIVQALEPGADTAKIQADVTALTSTIVSIAQSAQYNGINLVNAAAASVNVAGSIVRAGGALSVQNIATGAANLEALGAALVVGTATPDNIDTLMDTANAAAATFGAAQARIEAQNAFLLKQADALKMGVGAMVDADMEEASARLQALQVQQQLGIQALSIANQAPQNVLALFR